MPNAVSQTHSPHILIIGDIAGEKDYHVGDEAMVEANLARLRQRLPNARFTLISRDPDYSAALYDTKAIKPIGFMPAGPDSNSQNFARLEQVIYAAKTRAASDEPLPDGDSITHMVEVVYSADAVLISGGGNLSSTWPQHLFERTALVQIAHILGKPIAISGQTIGPNLDLEHALLLARVLPTVGLLGARELDTMQLALGLGVHPDTVTYQVDDAMHMPSEAPEGGEDSLKQPYIAVTLHAFAVPHEEDRALSVLARQFDQIADRTGLRFLFIPHVGQDDTGTAFSDVRIGHKLRGLLKNPDRMVVLGIENARHVIWRTQRAAMVISTRYHPIVFGLAGGVPCLGIYTDEYTRVKLQGALEHAGLERWSMPMKAALSDALFEAAAELWQRAASLTAHMKVFQVLWRALDDQHEQRILSALGLPMLGTQGEPELPTDLPDRLTDDPDPKGAWRSIVDAFIT